MFSLDKGTIAVIYVLCSILVCGFTIIIWNQNKTHTKGLGYWVIAHFMELAGVLLLGTQGFVHLFFSSFLAVFLILVGFYLFIVSFEFYFDQKGFRTLNILVIVTGLSAFFYYTMIQPEFRWRIVSFSIVLATMSLEAIIIFSNEMKKNQCSNYSIIFVSFVVYFINYCVRIINAIFGEIGSSYNNASNFENFFVVFSLIAGIMMMVGLVHMINGKLIDRLTNVIDEKEDLLRRTIDIAETDKLTNLMNRMKSEQMLVTLMNRSIEESEAFTMFLIDLDCFKSINDTYGHSEGDRVLQSFAQILRETLRKEDFAGRWGGDEFIVLVRVGDVEESKIIANKINDNVSKGIILREHQVTVSIGINAYEEGESASDFILKTDLALYDAKRQGRNRYSCYHDGLEEMAITQ